MFTKQKNGGGNLKRILIRPLERLEFGQYQEIFASEFRDNKNTRYTTLPKWVPIFKNVYEISHFFK